MEKFHKGTKVILAEKSLYCLATMVTECAEVGLRV